MTRLIQIIIDFLRGWLLSDALESYVSRSSVVQEVFIWPETTGIASISIAFLLVVIVGHVMQLRTGSAGQWSKATSKVELSKPGKTERLQVIEVIINKPTFSTRQMRAKHAGRIGARVKWHGMVSKCEPL